jgi:MFS family permease
MALLPWADGFLTLTVYLTITGIGHQIVRPTNTSWVSKQTKIGQGTAIGIMDTFLSLGRVFGPSAGKLYSPQTFQIPYWVSAAILVIASIGLFFPLRQLAISDRRNKENVSAVKK